MLISPFSQEAHAAGPYGFLVNIASSSFAPPCPTSVISFNLFVIALNRFIISSLIGILSKIYLSRSFNCSLNLASSSSKSLLSALVGIVTFKSIRFVLVLSRCCSNSFLRLSRSSCSCSIYPPSVSSPTILSVNSPLP